MLKGKGRRGDPRALLRAIGGKIGILDTDLAKWYEVTQTQLLRYGGIKLPSKDRNPIINLLTETFPDHQWDPSRFLPFPRAPMWSVAENRRAFLLYLGEKLGIKEGDFEPWYKVPLSKIKSNGGWFLCKAFQDQRAALLRSAIPEHSWSEDLFDFKPNNYWDQIGNRKKEVLAVGKRLGIQEGDYEAWYGVTSKELGLSAVVSSFSRFQLLSTVFPEHEWKSWLFIHKRTVNVLEMQEKDLIHLARFLERRLGITEAGEWNRVDLAQVRKIGFHSMFPTQSQLIRMLQVTYPKIHWKGDIGTIEIDKSEERTAMRREETDYWEGLARAMKLYKSEMKG